MVSGALAVISAGVVGHVGLDLGVRQHAVDEAHLVGLGGREQARGEEHLLGEGRADHVDEALQPGEAVAEAELRRRDARSASLAPQIRRSQHTASATPPPTQLPVICAMVGLGNPSSLP